MEKQIFYNGFKLMAKPEQDRFDKRWGVKVLIMRDTGFSATAKSFTAHNTYATEQEAIDHSLNYGKLIIDGKVEGCSVTKI